MKTVTRFPPRGGATAAAGRWHPYHASKLTPISTTPASCHTSSPFLTIPCHSYLNTPVSTCVPISENFRSGLTKSSKDPKTPTPTFPNIKERQDTKRAQKEKFENALKELAVQRLADIWKETSYVIHSTSSASSVSAAEAPRSCMPPPSQAPPAHQLPSPLTPSTHTFTSPPSTLSQPPASLGSSPRRMPLRAFVHEVLRRSKTMWPALQVALCYLDAARCKVPNVIAEVEQGEGLQAAEAALDKLFGSASADDLSGERQSSESSTPQTLISSPSSVEANATLPLGQSLSASDGPSTLSSPVPQAPAVAPVDIDARARRARPRRRRTPPVPVTPLPPRPSPLLCPRRMFIAALILATKFTQDRVYSNRAWAKISGLDAREVGRCERALGDALEWRLWVGKGVADEPTAFLRSFLLSEEALAKSRVNSGIARSKSDGVLFSGSKGDKTPEWSQRDSPPFSDLSSALKRSTSLASADLSGSPQTATPMLSDPATLLTPVNADIDAMDLERTPQLQHSTCSSASTSFSIDPTPSSSFFSSEFPFTPAPGIAVQTPRISSQHTPPDLHVSEAAMVSHAVSFSKFASGFKPEASLDAVMGFHQGPFDMGIDDIVGNG